MFLYKKQNEEYVSIKSNDFELEKDIQSVVEKNSLTFLNLEFIASEFWVRDFRLDTVCFDEETKSFVIIEYKLDKNSSLIDQGYSYLNFMMEYQADFVMAYSKKKGELFDSSYFNWNDSRVIFISQNFYKYQLSAYSSDQPFELIRIKKFDSENIILEYVTPQFSKTHKGSEKEALVPSKNATSTKKILKTSEEDHLKKVSDENIIKLYEEFKEKILEIGPYEVNITSSYIGFRLDKFNNLVTIHTRKDFFTFDVLLGWIRKDKSKSPAYFELDDPKNIANHKNWNNKDGAKGFSYSVVVDKNTTPEMIDYMIFLIKQKHNVLEKVKG